MDITVHNERASPLLRLPAELRIQIYEYVLGNRVVHVRMNWTDTRIPSGFLYTCHNDTQPLLTKASSLRKNAVPFGPEVGAFAHTCRLIQRETACLPFTLYTWAFETAYTLDQWIKVDTGIPAQHKHALLRVAVPTPGPYRASEQILQSLHELTLIGSVDPRKTYSSYSGSHRCLHRTLILLSKSKINGMWVRGSKSARYAKDLFE
jgi:hypothetical protein